MRGEKVIVRADRGIPAVLIVWEMGKRVVYLSSEAQHAAMTAGTERDAAIGFTRDDVFIFDQKWWDAIANNKTEPNWKQLRQFTGTG